MNCRFFAAIVFILATAITTARADTFYRDTFNFCEEPTGRPSAFNVAGWNAIKSNDPIGRPTTLKIQPVGASTRFRAVNSNPEGPEDGSAFWGRDDVTKGLLIYTDEINVDISEVTTVTWRQRIDRQVKVFANYQPRIAFLIDGTWYISDRIAPQIIRGIWERKEIAPYYTTYGTVLDTPGIGILAPTNSGVPLPSSGMISAAGLFMVRAYARVRIDDFALINAAPFGTSTPVSTYPRCQDIVDPGDPGDPDPTTTTTSSTTTTTLPPDIDEDPSPPEDPDVVTPYVPVPDANNFVVNLPGDSNTVPPPDESKFCSADDASSWVAMSSSTRKKLLRAAKGKKVIQMHDKLVLTLTSMGLRYNLLTDLGIGDLVRQNRRYYLLLSNGAKIRISSSLAGSINKYLKKAGINKSYGEPIFREFYSGIMSREPLCPAQMAELVRNYAARAKVTSKVSYY